MQRSEVTFSFAFIRVIRGHVSSPFVSIRLPRRSPWRAVVRRLPDEGGLAKAGVHTVPPPAREDFRSSLARRRIRD
ncbi:MAG: hypothetical protein DME69_13890 [Verrucomicrobia bacterium]|nr:MAG: hypothetical protein DME69_13890 [Verrucomicrobiota bacterium]